MGTLQNPLRITAILVILLLAGVRRVLAAGGIYLDTLAEAKTEQVIKLNPLDLGGESKWQNDPLLKQKKGHVIWLWTATGPMKAVFDRIVITQAEGDFHFLFRGSINVVVRASKPIPAGRVLVSLKALPEQTWKVLEPRDEDKTFAYADLVNLEGQSYIVNSSSVSIRVFETKKGTGFMIVRYPLPPTEVPGESFRTVVYKRDPAQPWVLYKKFDDAMVEPWFDVDGDGVPELVGESGYDSFGIKAFHPYTKILQQSTAGT